MAEAEIRQQFEKDDRSGDLREQVHGVRLEVRDQIQGVRLEVEKVRTEVARTETRLVEKIGGVETRLIERMDGLERSLRGWLMIGVSVIGAMIALMGLFG
ncbi:MAG: hypothetical protein OXQ32_05660 [bacterium]|nr:hypothetical protein [bacterium]